ncbi:MAG: CorA family divalent cation transporter [Clostridium sp.]
MRYRLTDQLTPLQENFEFQEGDIRVEIMTKEELENLTDSLSHKKVLIHYLKNVQYCKAEMFGNCIIGTFAIPEVKNTPLKKMEFGFYIMKDRIIFVEDSGEYVKSLLGRLKEIQYGGNASVAMFLSGFLDYLIEGDSEFLQCYEEKLIAMEDHMMRGEGKKFYENMVKCRKDMLHLHAYFTQLENLGEVFRSNTNHLFNEEERDLFAIFSHHVGRLNSHTEMLREYIVQIGQMYQAQLDLAQNHTMNLLTIVTTIFLPLTLLVGWYGMNFVNMPELQWQYGYIGIIILSIVTIIVEVYIFKKKNLL